MNGNRKRPTIGLLVDSLGDYYQNTVLWTAADKARERGMNLICFAGGILRSPNWFVTQRNAAFDLVGPENVDGLLILAGTIGNEVGADELARYCERFRPMPMCSIAGDLEGIPSVLADNDSGMREAVIHLIEHHGATRIAFIRGPAANEDAERRYRVYREVLAERGIELDPDLVVRGDFERPSGTRAVRTLIDERGARFEALVASSDEMAIGAMEALKQRGVSVPDKVAVVSYDDDEEARLCTPALTTVRQPLREQVARATEMLIDQLEGGRAAERVTIPTELKVRESCGCPSRVDSWLSKGEAERNEALATAIGEERAQARRRLQAERWARMLSDIGEELITSFDLRSLVESLVEQLPQLQIPSCFLSLYEGEGTATDRSRQVLSYDEGVAWGMPADGRRFESRRLVPEGMMPERASAHVLEPLFFEREQLGFALFEAVPREGSIYEALRDQISAALKGAGLLEQVVQKDRERRRLVRYILDVTPDLHRVQPVVDVAENILSQMTHLLDPRRDDGEEISHGDAPSGFLAVTEEESELAIRAGVGRFASGMAIEQCLEAEVLTRLKWTMGRGEIATGNGEIVIPLRTGELTVGVVYLEGWRASAEDLDLVSVLSNQATVAIHNIRLYEMATLDPLTGVCARRFFDRWMLRELRAAFRSGQPVALVMIDVDKMKGINDTAGHLVGDQALAAMGKVLRQATRNNDIVGRYGGDEFAVVLPNTDRAGADRVGQRIQELLEGESVPGPDGEIPLCSSVGLAVLEPQQLEGDDLRRAVPASYFQDVAKKLIQQADEALYRAKRAGRSRVEQGDPTSWLPAPGE